jgi:hypothetical protein
VAGVSIFCRVIPTVAISLAKFASLGYYSIIVAPHLPGKRREVAVEFAVVKISFSIDFFGEK